MQVGRPTKYSTEILRKAENYITGYADFGDVVPTIAGLACVLDVTRETCHAWANDPDKEAFSHILKKLMQRQERALVNGGLSGDFSSPVSKMMMTKHGYSDKVEQDHTSSDGSMKPLPVSVVIEGVQPADDNAED